MANKQDIINNIKALNVPGVIVDETATVEQLNSLNALLTSGDSLLAKELELEAAKEKITSLTADNDTKDQLLVDLNDKLQQAEEKIKSSKIVNPIITFEDKKYKVLHGGNISDGEGGSKFVSIEDIEKDPEIQKILITSGSGMLAEVK